MSLLFIYSFILVLSSLLDKLFVCISDLVSLLLSQQSQTESFWRNYNDNKLLYTFKPCCFHHWNPKISLIPAEEYLTHTYLRIHILYLSILYRCWCIRSVWEPLAHQLLRLTKALQTYCVNNWWMGLAVHRLCSQIHHVMIHPDTQRKRKLRPLLIISFSRLACTLQWSEQSALISLCLLRSQRERDRSGGATKRGNLLCFAVSSCGGSWEQALLTSISISPSTSAEWEQTGFPVKMDDERLPTSPPIFKFEWSLGEKQSLLSVWFGVYDLHLSQLSLQTALSVLWRPYFQNSNFAKELQHLWINLHGNENSFSPDCVLHLFRS